GVATYGFGLMALALASSTIHLLMSAVVLGLADGMYGVYLNGLIAMRAPSAARATVIGINATARNLGKFAAPATVSGVLLITGIRQALGGVAVVALLMSIVVLIGL